MSGDFVYVYDTGSRPDGMKYAVALAVETSPRAHQLALFAHLEHVRTFVSTLGQHVEVMPSVQAEWDALPEAEWACPRCDLAGDGDTFLRGVTA